MAEDRGLGLERVTDGTTSNGAPTGVAREMATRVLHRVATGQAWATPTLDAEIRRRGAEPRDAALATEIVYGALRVLPELDAAVAAHLKRGAKLDAWARAAMRAAAYQLLHLERVPPHAAVSGAVAIVRRERGKRVGGFVNAVLRKVAAQRPEVPARPRRMILPAWLERALGHWLGPERAEAFAEARELPPPLGLRACGEADRTEVADAIHQARPEASVREGEVSPSALLIGHAGDPRKLPGWEQGRFTVQEEGSQAVGWLAGAQPGERVADACAGRGGKSLQLAERVGPEGHVTALDLHEPKLDRIAGEAARLGIDPGRIDTVAIDLTVGTAGLDGQFDRVVVDAPCTNLGTVHRRPELLLRLGPDDPARLAELQLAILGGARRLLRPGGTLVYAVCSPSEPEGAGVVARFEQQAADLTRAPGPWPIGVSPDADGLVRLGMWNGGTDAYQIVRWILR